MDYKNLAWMIERSIHQYIQYEKKPRKYPGNLILTQPEVHTLALVGDNEGMNLTALAKMRCITKGAASQMINKLDRKGLIEKKVSPDSDSEINLFLTKNGEKIRAEHRKKHAAMWKKFTALFDGMPEENLRKIEEFFTDFEQELDSSLRSE